MAEARHEADIELVAAWIDHEWYLRECSVLGLSLEQVETSTEAARHYISIGYELGLTAHPYISNTFYLWSNIDVKSSSMDPFVHYIRHGHSERRAIHPILTSDLPLSALRDRQAISRYASALFDGPSYLATLSDSAALRLDPLEHYLSFGCLERRLPNDLEHFFVAASPSGNSDTFTPDAFVQHYCASSTPAIYRAREVNCATRCVFVLGMHRSGTSAVCGMLAQLGLQRSIRELPPQTDNPRGFFESQRIVEVNDRILSAFGSSWTDHRQLPKDYEKSKTFLAFKDQIATVFTEDFPIPGTAILKDPRLNKLFLGWRSTLSELCTKEYILIVTRHPLNVMRSLKKRDGMDERESMMLWLSYTLDAERQSRGARRSFLAFDPTCITTYEQLCKILFFFEVPHLEDRNFKMSFLDHNLCNFHDVTESEEANLHEWARRLWNASKQFVTDPENEDAMNVFDQVAASYRLACDAFADPLKFDH